MPVVVTAPEPLSKPTNVPPLTFTVPPLAYNDPAVNVPMLNVPVLVNNPLLSEPLSVKLPALVALPLLNTPRVTIPAPWLPMEPPLNVVTVRLPEMLVAVPPLRVVTVAVPMFESVPEYNVASVEVPWLVNRPPVWLPVTVKEPVEETVTAPPLKVPRESVPLFCRTPVEETSPTVALATEARVNVPALCAVNVVVEPVPDSVNEPPANVPSALITVPPLSVIEPSLMVVRYAEPAIKTVPLLMVPTAATPEKFVTPEPPVIEVMVEEPLVAKKLRLPPLFTMASSVSALDALTVAPEDSVKSFVSPKCPVTFNVPAETKVVPPLDREPEITSVPTPDLVRSYELAPSVMVPPIVRLPATTFNVMLFVKYAEPALSVPLFVPTKPKLPAHTDALLTVNPADAKSSEPLLIVNDPLPSAEAFPIFKMPADNVPEVNAFAPLRVNVPFPDLVKAPPDTTELTDKVPADTFNVLPFVSRLRVPPVTEPLDVDVTCFPEESVSEPTSATVPPLTPRLPLSVALELER